MEESKKSSFPPGQIQIQLHSVHKSPGDGSVRRPVESSVESAGDLAPKEANAGRQPAFTIAHGSPQSKVIEEQSTVVPAHEAAGVGAAA